MSDEQRVTLGEVYRLCQSIDKKVDTQNGRVTALERDALRIKTIWSVGAAAVIFLGDSIKHRLGL